MNYVRHPISDAAPFPTTVQNPPEFPRPTSFREFVAQCQVAEIQLFFDDGIDDRDVTGNEAMGFQMIQIPADTAFVRLPESLKIKASEDRLLNKFASYPLPGFYERIFETPPEARANQLSDPEGGAPRRTRRGIHDQYLRLRPYPRSPHAEFDTLEGALAAASPAARRSQSLRIAIGKTCSSQRAMS